MSSQSSDDGYSAHDPIKKLTATVKLFEQKSKKGQIPKTTIKLKEHLTLMEELVGQLPPPGSQLTTQHNILLSDINECGQMITKLIGHNVNILFNILNDFISNMELAQCFKEEGLPLPTAPPKTTRPRKNKRSRIDNPISIEEETVNVESSGYTWGFEDDIDHDLLRNFSDLIISSKEDQDVVHELPAAEEDQPKELQVHVEEEPHSAIVAAVQEHHDVVYELTAAEEPRDASVVATTEVPLRGPLLVKRKKNVFRKNTFYKTPTKLTLRMSDLMLYRESPNKNPEFDIFGLMSLEDINFDFITSEVADLLKDFHTSDTSSNEQATLEEAPLMEVNQGGLEAMQVFDQSPKMGEPPLKVTDGPPLEEPQIEPQMDGPPLEEPQVDKPPPEGPLDEMSFKCRDLLIKIKTFSSETVTFLELCPIGTGREEVARTFETLLNLYAKNEIVITQTSPKAKDILITLVLE